MHKNEWEQSKEILKRYFKRVFDESGVKWTSKDDTEIDKLLDLIKKGSYEEGRKALENAVKKRQMYSFGNRL